MEVWKDIRETGWKVSNEGRIMNKRGHISTFTTKGYPECKVGIVHRIVAYYFCNPPCEADNNWNCLGYEVHHKNRITTDNRAVNLEYVTYEQHKEIHKKKIKRETDDEKISKTLIMNYLNSLRN